MKKKTLINTVEIGVMAAIIAICSWISLNVGNVPFTLQTFGVFLALQVLGGANGTIAVLVYIILGLVGVPVFAGFTGGVGIILGPTGGYIVGFLIMGVIYWFSEKVQKNTLIQVLILVLGLVACYGFGTIWFSKVYANQGNAVTLWAVLGWCVFPFIIPDAVKLAVSVIISKNLKKVLPKIKKI